MITMNYMAIHTHSCTTISYSLYQITCVSQISQLKILLKQSFHACVPLLMTSVMLQLNHQANTKRC